MKKLLLIPAFMTMFFVGTVAVSAAFAAQPAPPRKNCSPHTATVILICCDC